jgi:2-keto-4-pentenoate hydratase
VTTAISQLAADLAAARRGRYAIPARRVREDVLTFETAYELGRDLEHERVSTGWRPVGWKLGFTNQALWSHSA